MLPVVHAEVDYHSPARYDDLLEVTAWCRAHRGVRLEIACEVREGGRLLVDGYTRDGRLIGHIVRGVVNIERAGAAVGAARERTTLLQHLVLSHHGDAEFGSPVPPKCPEAQVLSELDRLDAKLFQMFAALDGVKPGEFSPPVFGLDKAEIYKAEPPAPGQSC